MNDIIATFSKYFSYDFVRYAFIVGVLISLCSSMLGVTLVLKRLSYIGDSLSHTAFGLIAISTLLGMSDNMIFVLISMILITIFIMRGGKQVKGDAALTMMSSGALGVGYLILNFAGDTTNLAADVCTTLFGSTAILTLTKTDVFLCLSLSIVVILTYILMYHKIFAITFDEDFAKATGVNTNFYTLILSIILAIIVVLAMNLVGSLLISALVVFPALSSMRVFKSFKSVIISSAIFSVVCSTLGILLSILYGSPVGSTIVAIDIAGFILFNILGKVRKI